MAYTRVNGVRLFYERRGAGEPLLFITGFAIPAAVFDPVLDDYAERFECVTYDNRSSGRSSAPLRPTSIPEMAADAAALLERLGIESAHVYGLSMGGMIAQELALRFPERVRGLVLGCTTPGGPRAVRPTVRELLSLGKGMLGGLAKPGRPWLAPAVFSPEFRREEPEEVLALLEGFGSHRPTPWGANYHLLASVYHDTASRLDQIQAPTLVMHGERDAMDPVANSLFMAERIPDAELAIVPGAGHAYPLEAPEESLARFTEWLAAKSPIAPGRPRSGATAAVEPLTRLLGLPIGALRTGRSAATYAVDLLSGRRPRGIGDRRAAEAARLVMREDAIAASSRKPAASASATAR
ncbi:MAG: alpha/beta fold hydrolase [Thermoleophilaceae bacterium]